MLSQPSEMHRDVALGRRLHAATCQDTTHKETQARSLLCRAGLPLTPSTSPTSSPGPVTAVKDGFSRAASLPRQATVLSGTKDTPALPLAHSKDQSLQLL